MVFCCIAIAGFAVIYFCFLTLRQLFSRPTRDKIFPGKVPPRAITCNGALPVYGHTRLFTKWGGNVALMFSPDMYEWSGCSFCCNRQLGVLYSIFIWGQWRIVIQGAERVQQVLRQQSLKEGWPWTPPITLLGKSCLDLLEPADADVLANFLQTTLKPSEVISFAPVFAEYAELNLQSIVNRKCHQNAFVHNGGNGSRDASGAVWSDPDDDDRILDDRTHKIKWDALRSYSLDLMDGPILNMHLWNTRSSDNADIESTINNGNTCSDLEAGLPEHSGRRKDSRNNNQRQIKKQPDRNLALLWMERVKAGLCVIKLTFGTEWMQIWRMNEYGRALNARRYIETMISDHVAERVKDTPTLLIHAPGHFIHDWLSAPFPLLTLTENLLHKREGVVGDGKSSRPQQLERSKSDSNIDSALRTHGFNDNSSYGMDASEDGLYPTPLNTEQDLAAPQFESPIRSSKKLKAMLSSINPSPMTNRASCNEIFVSPPIAPIPFSFEPSQSSQPTSPVRQETSKNTQAESVDCIATPLDLASSWQDKAEYQKMTPDTHEGSSSPETPRFDCSPISYEAHQSRPLPLLDRIIRQEEREGKGISHATITEVCILLWMAMDAGNAWTAMALSLISSNEEARTLVQDELDSLVQVYGRERLFTPRIMSRMKYLDALLYEAIRLCPPFLGGMKVTQETVVFNDLGLQVPKNCNVFFCQPTHENFDLANAIGKRPETLGSQYPCAELHGFLPLKGLEVPLMVLQSKVFLAVLLQRFSPYVSKRRTFIRRVTQALTCSLRNKDFESIVECGKKVQDETDEFRNLETFHQTTAMSPNRDHLSNNQRHEITQSDAMRLFTKIPFPEPKRVIHIREREDASNFEPTTPTFV